MAIRVKKGKPPAGDINITPLIDVVLVLLIIFMVITPILIHEMAVNLPEKTVSSRISRARGMLAVKLRGRYDTRPKRDYDRPRPPASGAEDAS